jgi:endonuclease I
MKKNILSVFCLFSAIFLQVCAQIPSGYYNNVNGKKGKELQIALNQIINNHRSISYAEVWFYYQYTDVKPSGKIWDIYSDNPQGTPDYEFNYRTDQCTSGSGGAEGTCYQREHSFCQSWFGGGQAAPYTDIFHLYPVDGWINNLRSNNAYGMVTTHSQLFLNGSKLGSNTYPDAPDKTCYEPIDSFKGDIARTFFYMSARYMFEDENFQIESSMTFKSQLQPWALKMLLEWHQLDPVSQKEIDRNNAIYAVQRNRNPFIDHPEWVAKIWSSDSLNPVQITPANPPEKPRVKWFSLTDNRTLKITFTQPMIAWTTENPLNYYISEAVSVTSLHYSLDTLVVHIGGLFSQNATYKLSIKHLLAKNMAFLNDTAVSFLYPYKVEQKPLLAWTFDYLEGSPNTPKRILAEYHLLDTVSEAVLFCDGSYKSSNFVCAPSSTELNSYTGTTLGDPRPKTFRGKDIAFVNESANGKSVVFKFPTKGYFNLALSMAVRRSSTSAFDTHLWEWSLDGENYTLIENTSTCPLTTGGDHVPVTLDLRTIDELDDKEEVFLRMTLKGCKGATSNNRFDNITLHGVSIYGNKINDEKKLNNRFFIAPNPNQGQFYIINFSEYFNSIGYEIFNSSGQKIQTGKIDNSLIDISNHPNGIYYCKVLCECLKIVKTQ